MMKAEKTPSGNYRVRITVNGKCHSITAPSKSEALRLARIKKVSANDEQDSTVKSACESYINNRASIISPNTLIEYQGYLSRHIDSIANKKLSALTNTNIQAWVNELSASLSPKSVKNIYGFVMASVGSQMPSKRFNITLPKKIKSEAKVPSEAEIRAIMDATIGTDLEVPFRMALFCCLRRGEICGILNHPECVNRDSVTVKYNVIHTENGWKEKAPKTYTSYRTVPCPEELTSKIKTARVMTPAAISCMWAKLMKKMGMSYSFHSIRHVSASLMLSCSIPVVDVEKFGGWQHGSSVLHQIYTSNIDESLKKSANIWQGKLKELTPS